MQSVPLDEGTVSILEAMQAAIQRRYNEASDNPDHYQKVAWFVGYWNTYIPTISRARSGINGLGAISPEPV